MFNTLFLKHFAYSCLETMQDNFTTFSVKIFAKHNEIMTNLNRVENTADKILRQLGTRLHFTYMFLPLLSLNSSDLLSLVYSYLLA